MNTTDAFAATPEIAVIGFACRFPGAKDADAYWHQLQHGVELIRQLDDDELRQAGIDADWLRHPHYVKARAVLEDIERFEADFFGMTAAEARLTDPQHRLLLEIATESLEHAGYDASVEQRRIGIFAGTSLNTYLLHNLLRSDAIEPAANFLQALIASDKDFLATRIAYMLNLHGPAVTVQTACSTSLVAVHMACQSLLSGESDLALAGGACVRVPQIAGYFYQEGGIFSPDGHCRPFDAAGQGTLDGSGAGLVLLKRLEEAVADRDTIHAVVKGSAINNDGWRKVGYTAPSIEGQMEVIAEAQAIADVDPDTLTYIETHGTATPLGDPCEIRALTKVFGDRTRRTGFCAIGSVKSNMGHADTAAGIAGFIKTILALKNQQLPPSLHFHRPNPNIDFASSPFYVNTELRAWRTDGGPRRAGVSSFGVGGTNAHVIVEEAPAPPPSGPTRAWQLVTLSARTPSALDTKTEQLVRYFSEQPETDFADGVYTANMGRRQLQHRRFVVCQNREEACRALELDDASCTGHFSRAAIRPEVVLMFPGQGAQYVGMGRGLYDHDPHFRRTVDSCADFLQRHHGLNILPLLLAPNDPDGAYDAQLQQTRYTQPTLFVVEYALAQLWMSWGITPQAMIGHSLGEVVAACVAGVFSVQDALTLVALRGRLMGQGEPGAMLAVRLPEAELHAQLPAELSLAAVNTPHRCVVAGAAAAIVAWQQHLQAQGVECRRVHTAHAFHSALMAPAVQPFVEAVHALPLHEPRLPFVSNVSGTWITAEEATDPAYWGRHIRQPVRFSDGIRTLLAQPDNLFLELGPGHTLAAFARQHRSGQSSPRILTSMRHAYDHTPDQAVLLHTLGQAWLRGVEVQWSAFYADEQRRRLPLPTYPFERQRYWIAPDDGVYSLGGSRTEGRKIANLDDWFYVPSWKRSLPPVWPATPAPRVWLVCTDGTAAQTAVLDGLEAAGQTLIRVEVGQHFEVLAPSAYRVQPQHSDDFVTLARQVSEQGLVPDRILLLWTLGGGEETAPLEARLRQRRPFVFDSLLYLARAFGAQRSGSQPLTMIAIAAHLFRVGAMDCVHPETALLLGPCTVIPQEFPALTCRVVDLSAPLDPAMSDILLADLLSDRDDDIVAYRGPDRWLRSYEAVRLGAPVEPIPRLKERGVYLITGGLGGVGFALARYLAATVRARLVLLGRTPWPVASDPTRPVDPATQRRIDQVRQLEALGAEVEVVCADVTDAEAMRQVASGAQQRYTHVDGIIHAAGVSGGGLIALRRAEEFDAVLAPKVRGTLALYQAFQHQSVDFILFCSSIASILGGIGQVDYTAANAFLDAFAQSVFCADGPLILSVNWDAWEDIGMSAALRALVSRLSNASDTVSPVDAASQSWTVTMAVESHWVLREHRVQGRYILPGTAYLDMVWGAAVTPGREVILQEVYYLSPLQADMERPRQVQTVLTATAKGMQFAIKSRDETDDVTGSAWELHASGRLQDVPATAPVYHDLNTIKARCAQQVIQVTEALRHDTLQPQYDIEHGPRWSSLHTVYLGECEALAVLQLDAIYEGDFAQHPLHPALLDLATGFAMPHGADALFLPFAYRGMHIKAPLTSRLYSYVRYDTMLDDHPEVLTFAVCIMDDQGRELVTIEEYTMKRVAAAWRSAALPAGADGPESTGTAHVRASRALLSEGMSVEEGIQVFARLLTLGRLDQIVISTQDFPHRIRQFRGMLRQHLTDIAGSTTATTMQARPSLPTPYAAPRNDVEQQLATLWAAMLGLERVGIYDNFFELGGDSVMGIQIVAKAAQEGLNLNLAQLFQAQTIAALSAILGTTDTSVDQGRTVPATPDNTLEAFVDTGLSAAALQHFLKRIGPDA